MHASELTPDDPAKTGAPVVSEFAAEKVLGAAPNESLRILTCGSVDDGKSTLIGRLLWDASDLAIDQREMIERRAESAGAGPDFSRLVDGLAAEREQGITIDIAWRTFDTNQRRFVIIDSPGHEQYTRNMASGASHADVAIMLTDARHGVKPQTRRHAAILDLMGVKHVILAVNKMDLVDWSQSVFDEIAEEFRALTLRFGFQNAVSIPVAAVSGDNVATRSARTEWYRGPTLLEHLNFLPPRAAVVAGAFRMPVQMVLRDGRDFRGLAGTISSGRVEIGDEVVDVLSGKRARVQRIATFDGELTSAEPGRAVVIGLDRDIDVARGHVLAAAVAPPSRADGLTAQFVWLAEQSFDANAGYLLRTATDLVPIDSVELAALMDLETLTVRPSAVCTTNDIAVAKIALGRPVVLDAFTENCETGAFMIVDAITGASVAGGIVLEPFGQAERSSGAQFVLDSTRLAAGLCRDLGSSAEDRAEFKRRAAEVALILRAAGVKTSIDV
ncbi:GTP-binding protein [Filomicrobium sp.]|uniref:GTP-binding protein n=1 Tax=Filomicrobium sp. TaxID=2024831 RepID=UPI00258BAB5F|nr:GTP-binding protein [Filomicrobium sp.]MCV0370532.1 50S ribosome-binding GTPase [Filomicrobium sp.]